MFFSLASVSAAYLSTVISGLDLDQTLQPSLVRAAEVVSSGLPGLQFPASTTRTHIRGAPAIYGSAHRAFLNRLSFIQRKAQALGVHHQEVAHPLEMVLRQKQIPVLSTQGVHDLGQNLLCSACITVEELAGPSDQLIRTGDASDDHPRASTLYLITVPADARPLISLEEPCLRAKILDDPDVEVVAVDEILIPDRHSLTHKVEETLEIVPPQLDGAPRHLGNACPPRHIRGQLPQSVVHHPKQPHVLEVLVDEAMRTAKVDQATVLKVLLVQTVVRGEVVVLGRRREVRH